jgi:hypothetical protein
MKKVILGLVFITKFIILTMVRSDVIPTFAADKSHLVYSDCKGSTNVQQRYGIDSVKDSGTTGDANFFAAKGCLK